jgi:hypothetical protein
MSSGESFEEPGPFEEFGPFKVLFEPPPGDLPAYLSLLNLRTDAPEAVRLLREAIDRSGSDLILRLSLLLDPDEGWRPQLVAAAAMVAGGIDDARAIGCLWVALDHHSFVSPQLAAAASRLDKAFLSKARSRLENRCRVQLPETMRLPAQPAPPEGEPAPKLLSALVALSREAPGNEAWLTALLASSDVAQILAADRDDGGEIALEWLDRLDRLLAGTG